MIILDMRTVIILSIFAYIICTLFIVRLWQQNRRRFTGMDFWVFNFALQMVALILIVLRGVIPDWASIVLANTLMFAGGGLIYMGLERFVEKPSDQLYNYALFALYIGAFVYATFINPDLHLRTLIASIGFLIISFQALWLLWRRVELTMRPLTFGVGMVFGGYCIVSIVRIGEYFVGAHAGGNYFQSGTFQTLVIVSYQMLLILLTYSLVLMVNKRLLMKIGTEEEKFFKAFQSSPYAITLTRLVDGKIIEVNESFSTITGYDRAEVLEKNTTDLNLWENEEDRAAVVDALSRNGSVRGMELRFRKKTGEAVTGLLSAEIILIDGEKIILSSISDITERKRAEEVLRESAQRYMAIIHTAMDGFWRVDMQGSLLEVNETYSRMSGYSVQELLNMRIPDLEVIETEQETAAHLQKILAQGSDRFESQHRRKDGIIYEIETSVQYQPANGGQIVAFLRDISDRKKAGAEKAKLETHNRQLQKSESLGRMAGAIAHTFNNQLGVVIGNLEMAIDDLPQDTRFRPSLTAAMQAAQKAAAISGQMLTYLGQTPGVREPLDLSDACLRGLPMLRAVIPGEMTLETALPSPGPIISTNSNQIQQVLTNLVTNAWEAVADGRGAIHLRVKTVFSAQIPTIHRYPAEWQPQDHCYACLEVTDAGGGIADKDIEALFDPFFSSKFVGRGMGLAVVMGIVKAHNGVVTVESKPGQGSTFRTFFPVSKEEVTRQPKQAFQYPKFEAGGTLLLVEDEEMVRNMAAAMLKRLGFSVLEAKDGVEAVEIFRQHQDEIRCVLSDLTMPRLNGWETLTALRKLQPGIPVILASGYDKAYVMAGDHPESPQAFLGKPYKLKELGDAINQALVQRN